MLDIIGRGKFILMRDLFLMSCNKLQCTDFVPINLIRSEMSNVTGI